MILDMTIHDERRSAAKMWKNYQVFGYISKLTENWEKNAKFLDTFPNLPNKILKKKAKCLDTFPNLPKIEIKNFKVFGYISKFNNYR